MKTILLAITALTAIGITAPAHAANVIDQSAPAMNAGVMAYFSQGNLAQSFTPGASNVSGAGIFLTPASGTANITIGLWNALPNQAGATRLAFATGSTSSGNQWFDVFWSPAAVIANKTYFLTFDSNSSNYGIDGDVDNGYTRGNVYANNGYQSFAGYDYTFRSFTDNAATGAVPEPATWAMMILGMGAVGYAMRRRIKVSEVNFTNHVRSIAGA